MEKYRQEREKQEKLSRVSGGILTVAVHAVLVACFFVTGFTEFQYENRPFFI